MCKDIKPLDTVGRERRRGGRDKKNERKDVVEQQGRRKKKRKRKMERKKSRREKVTTYNYTAVVCGPCSIEYPPGGVLASDPHEKIGGVLAVRGGLGGIGRGNL